MPQQDAQGRWLSDDGHWLWDGQAWRPVSPPPQRSFGVACLGGLLLLGFLIALALLSGLGRS